MDFVLEVLKLTIPSAVVFATVYFMLKQHFEAEEKRSMIRNRTENSNVSSPLKIQAYERLILFLERISPDNLAMRTQKKGMTARVHHAEMLKIIRNEYDHNVTQQLYISSGAWKIVKQVKEESIRIVNVAASKNNDGATALDLTKSILGIMTKLDQIPTEVAKQALRQEFRSQF